MPLKRYEIRNEYSLGDPDVYKLADKDDPEALLEGVAMSGLVGLLRQLGDLAEFAAEIFHDLHEEVLSTAARGHGLIARVQQMEAEFPNIERKLLSQTSHTSFLYNSGIDWHPNLCMDQNTVTQGDLPRFVMDSYEECRGPPRLFLLDKFDVAGAGACLKRFTDPSFFKMESASSTGRKSAGQREKKTRKVKKRGPRWRNGDTPESFPSSHAKLHQLFLEERIESGGNDPDRRVKLKKRQFTGSLFEQDNVKSYMEIFLDTCSPEQKIVHEIIDPLSLTWTSHNASESGLEIVEIGTVSPLKESLQTDKAFCLLPETRDIVLNQSKDDYGDDRSYVITESEPVEGPGHAYNSHDDNISSTITKVLCCDDFADEESNSENDACDSDDVASEIDKYMDALATMESEAEMESECKKYPSYLNQKPVEVGSDVSLGQQELLGGISDSQSIGNSIASEDGNHSLRESETSSCSNSVNALPETAPDVKAVFVADPLTPAINLNQENMFSDHHSTSEEIYGKETEQYTRAGVDVNVDDIAKSGRELEMPSGMCLVDPKTEALSVHMEAHLVDNCLPQRAFDDEGRWFSEQPTHHTARENSSVSSDALPDLPYASDVTTEKVNSMYGAPVVGCIPTTEGKTNNPSPVADSTESFSIQEHFFETTPPDRCTPSRDSEAGFVQSSQVDSNIKEASAPAELGDKEIYAIVGESELSLPSSNGLQSAAPEFFTCGISDVAESKAYEEGATGASSRYQLASEICPEYAGEEMTDDSKGKPPSVLEPENMCQKLQLHTTGAALLSSHQAEFSSDIINASEAQTEQVEASSCNHPDENNVFSNNVSLSEIPLNQGKESDSDADEVKVEHTEMVAVAANQADVSDDHNRIVNPLSACALHPEEFDEQSISSTTECHDKDDSTEGLKADLSEHKLMVGELVVDRHLPSYNNAQDIELASSLQMPLLETKESYAGSLSHGFLKQVCPQEESLDVQDNELEQEPLHADGVFREPGVYYKQIHTPEYTESYGHVKAASYNQGRSLLKLPSSSVEESLEISQQALTESSLILSDTDVADNADQVTLQEDSGKPEDVPDNPFIDTHPSEPQMNLEAPPLPPLPPMQWRLGRFQNSSAAVGRPHTNSQLHFQPISLPALHHSLGHDPPMSLPTVYHTLASVQPIALPAAHYTISPVQPLTLPLQNPATAQTSESGRQSGYSDGYMAMQRGFTLPMLATVSDGYSLHKTPVVATQDNLLIPSASASAYVAMQGGFTVPMMATVSESRSGNGMHDTLLFPAPSTLGRPQSDSLISNELNQPNVISPESAVSFKVNATEHNHGEMKEYKNANGGAPDELLEDLPQVMEHEAANSYVEFLPSSAMHQVSAGFMVSEGDRTWLRRFDGVTNYVGNINVEPQKKLLRPRNPLIDEVVAIDKSKLRKVERVNPSSGSKTEEGESLWEQMQLRKVERVKQPEEAKVAGGCILEQWPLRKVGERVKQPVEQKFQETEFLPEHMQLRKVAQKVETEAEPKAEETESPRVQLRNVSERVKQGVEVKVDETESPWLQLRKVSERVKQGVEVKVDETESPRLQLRKVSEKSQPPVEPKPEERDTLFEQIRNKAFSLKPAAAARPNIQGPKTNLKVAAILEKASNIRQAMAGSDEDDDPDNWGDS